MNLSQASAMILGLSAGGTSATALIVMHPPYFDVACLLLDAEGDAVGFRQFLASVALVFGCIAAMCFTHALKVL
jgi:pimeloyl-ACP methyl ester carboxylesterase